MKASAIILSLIASMALGQATRPAATQPATSQPSRNFGRYYNLVKNEFMKDEGGEIVIVPDEVKAAIAEIRRNAQEEKKAIDADITSLTREIAAADADRKAAEKQAREHAKTARENERKSVWYEYRTNQYGGLQSSSRWVDRVKASAAESARKRQEERKAAAARAKGDISAMRAELMQLKRESAALASAASPYNRNLPPKMFWQDLPADLQKQLGRVGITQDEFKEIVKYCGMTEAQFLDAAYKLDQKTRGADELTDKIMELFKEKMKPSSARKSSTIK